MSSPIVTSTVVAPRAVPLMTRLRPLPVEPGAGEVIWTTGRSGLAAWTSAAGQNAIAATSVARIQAAWRVEVERI